jgi:FkbM family methyltransferase
MGVMIVNRNDWATAADGGRYGVGAQLLDTGAYEWDECMKLVKIASFRKMHHGNDVLVFDVGANVGAITLFLARAMAGWGKVIAAEAQERLYYALCGNIALQNAFNARAIAGAASDKMGWLEFTEPDYCLPGSYGSLELKPGRGKKPEYIGQDINYLKPTNRVAMFTIDSLHLERLDILKIDIEGMEIEALNGAVDTIMRCKPVLWIEHIKIDKTALEGICRQHGYRFGYIDMNLVAVHESDPTKNNMRFE